MDEAFKKKIENIVRNIKLLQRDGPESPQHTLKHNKEICDLIFVKKKFHIYKLM